MSFDTNLHLASKTIGLAPLVKLLANVQKTGQSEDDVDPSRHVILYNDCLLYTSPSPRDRQKSRMPSSA